MIAEIDLTAVDSSAESQINSSTANIPAAIVQLFVNYPDSPTVLLAGLEPTSATISEGSLTKFRRVEADTRLSVRL